MPGASDFSRDKTSRSRESGPEDGASAERAAQFLLNELARLRAENRQLRLERDAAVERAESSEAAAEAARAALTASRRTPATLPQHDSIGDCPHLFASQHWFPT